MQANTLRSLLTHAFCVVLALGFAAQTRAEDKKADPTGNWTWTMPGRNGGPDRKITLKLKAEGDKVTGKIGMPTRDGNRETDIKEGKLKGDELSFNVVREVNGNTMTSKYKGKVTEDTIKGKMEFERNGEAQTRDWEAKRATEGK